MLKGSTDTAKSTWSAPTRSQVNALSNETKCRAARPSGFPPNKSPTVPVHRMTEQKNAATMAATESAALVRGSFCPKSPIRTAASQWQK